MLERHAHVLHTYYVTIMKSSYVYSDLITRDLLQNMWSCMPVTY